jgi:two-component system, NarL family, response regulator DegU
MKKYTAIIADDHPIFRNGVRDILEEIGNIDLLGAAKDGAEAYQLILAHRPDIAILDLEMPHLTGLEVCQKAKSEKNDTKFILLTMHKGKHFFESAMQAGVQGYLLKDNAIEDLILCIEAILKGETYVSSDIEQFLTEHNEATENPNVQKANALLSPTEKVILKLIAEGKTSMQIADLLFISANTVDNHRYNMNKKLDLEGKNSLMKFAMLYLR